MGSDANNAKLIVYDQFDRCHTDLNAVGHYLNRLMRWMELPLLPASHPQSAQPSLLTQNRSRKYLFYALVTSILMHLSRMMRALRRIM